VSRMPGRPLFGALFCLASAFLPGRAFPCTIAVVSGRATADGRPLIWKNRDTGVLNNKVVCVTTGRIPFLGLVNADDNAAESVWAGGNAAGFVIMNSLSADLGETPESGGGNGSFMAGALAECATVRDFERLLDRTNGRRDTAANFGVMDAEGTACLFETGRSAYVKFDAADARVAPQGYILRTNFALTASKRTGGGYNRFDRVTHLFQAARAENRLGLPFILREAARDLVNEKILSDPLGGPVRGTSIDPQYIHTNDTINRYITSFAAVFHGVTARDKAFLTSMWVMLGPPIASVAVPVWAAAPAVPLVLTGEGTAPLDDVAQDIRRYLYPDQRPNMNQYLNVTRLRTYRETGVLDRTLAIEEEVLDRAAKVEAAWGGRKPSLGQVMAFEGGLAAWAYERFSSAFAGLRAPGPERR
jgi:hypothetical protein